MTEYQKLLEAVADYYGAGSDQWSTIASSSNIGSTEWYDILTQTPNVNVITNKAGEVVSYTVDQSWGTAADSITGVVDSNTQVATMTKASKISIPANNTVSQQGYAAATSGLKEVNGGATVGGVIREVAGAAVAVGAGVRLGATIDSLLYNANPDFWDEHNLSSLNPETWDSLVSDYGEGAQSVFNLFFGINKTTGKTSPYMDERALAYMAQYLVLNGAFDSSEPTGRADSSKLNVPAYYNQPITFIQLPISLAFTDQYGYEEYLYTGDGVACITKSSDNYYHIIWLSGSTIRQQWWRDGDLKIDQNIPLSSITSLASGETANEWAGILDPNSHFITTYAQYINDINATGNEINYLVFQDLVTFYNYREGGGVYGIDTQTGATLPTGITESMDIDDVIAYLKTVYPDWWDDALYNDVLQPDGTNKRYVYIPTAIPDTINIGATSTDIQPIGGVDMLQDDPTISGDEEGLVQTLLELLTSLNPNSPTDTPPADTTDYPNTGEGNTPAIVTPTGSASALYSVYNPTEAELNSLGAWLWSSNFVDQLLKLFSDPMQAIIGLHKIFATPSVSGTGNIKVGYLDSGVSSNLVSDQYTEVDCGSVSLSEYFGNVLDYTDTDIYLYLPFIGIVPVSALDITRSTINIKYKVDVLTGACLAQVYVNRDNNAGGQLYVYAGDCAVKYPLSSGSYMGIVTSALGIAGSIAGTIASGGAMLPLALGAGASALNGAKTRVEHSGSVSGNAGAMGIKKPYLIIRRPQTKIADNFHIFNGQSENVFDVLGNCSGYTRIKYVNLENISATGEELTEIESILKDGVII